MLDLIKLFNVIAQPNFSNVGDPLDQLRPTVDPMHAISWWPLAPGWWVLLLLSALVIILSIYLRPFFRARKAAREIQANTKDLLISLYEQCQQEANKTLASKLYLQQSNEIFKRTVNHRFPNESYGSLTGQAWVDFLKTYSNLANKNDYSKYYGNKIYAKKVDDIIDFTDIHHWAMDWTELLHKHNKEQNQ